MPCQRTKKHPKVLQLSSTVLPPTGIENEIEFNDTITAGTIPTKLPTNDQSPSSSEEITSTRYVKKTTRAILELNQALNELAEKAGNCQNAVASIDAATQAEILWKNSITTNVNGNNASTDVISFNTVLKAWGRCCQTLVEKHKAGHFVESQQQQPQKIEILDITSPPPIVLKIDNSDGNPFGVYTASDAARHAEQLLQTQIFQSSEIAADDESDSVSSSSDDENNNISKQQELKIKPDTHSFNIVMDAWSKSRDQKRAIKHVEKLFKQMKYNKDLTNALPDTLSYGALVDAVAYSKNPKRFERLDEIWNEMQNYRINNNNDTRVRPSVRIMNSILHAYSRRTTEYEQNTDYEEQQNSAYEYAERSSQILDEMKTRYQQTKDFSDQPDVMTYTVGEY